MPEKPYDHQQIELKWQERWNNSTLFQAEENSTKPKPERHLDTFAATG
jgi:leucyl-tRNA synthetase